MVRGNFSAASNFHHPPVKNCTVVGPRMRQRRQANRIFSPICSFRRNILRSACTTAHARRLRRFIAPKYYYYYYYVRYYNYYEVSVAITMLHLYCTQYNNRCFCNYSYSRRTHYIIIYLSCLSRR